ncbi:MAG: hypothetical protein LBU42_05910 [Prevotellaceae bacterium]|jgi:hypothetical protein|nr:hypothetical protein [Prevotellaceae bacterium]
MKKILSFAAILLMLAGSLSCMISCKKENPAQVCDVNNPLTDLEWLRQLVADLETFTTHIRIYQCIYETNKIGFLIEPCRPCPEGHFEFLNCEGSMLCTSWGIVASGCEEFYVDFENKKRIWENNKN